MTEDFDGTARTFNLLMLSLICLMLGCHFFSARRLIYLLPTVATINGVAISCFGIFQKLRTEES